MKKAFIKIIALIGVIAVMEEIDTAPIVNLIIVTGLAYIISTR